MELLDGCDLSKYADDRRRKSAPLSLHEVMNIFKQATLALAYIHDKGWVHADIKTNNIYVDTSYFPPRPFLTDFTSTRQEGKRIDPESPSWVMGTFEYESINRMKKLPPTKADDIYALGISLCETLLGEDVILRYDYLGYDRKAVKQSLTADEAFQHAQDRLRRIINESDYPRIVKELMRKMTWHARRRPFSDCHEIAAFIDKIYRELRLDMTFAELKKMLQ